MTDRVSEYCLKMSFFEFRRHSLAFTANAGARMTTLKQALGVEVGGGKEWATCLRQCGVAVVA